MPDTVVFGKAPRAGRGAIAAGAGAMWFPLVVIDEAAAQHALDARLDVVTDRCRAIEWARPPGRADV
jgi:predicted CoA-binding protein